MSVGNLYGGEADQSQYGQSSQCKYQHDQGAAEPVAGGKRQYLHGLGKAAGQEKRGGAQQGWCNDAGILFKGRNGVAPGLGQLQLQIFGKIEDFEQVDSHDDHDQEKQQIENETDGWCEQKRRTDQSDHSSQQKETNHPGKVKQ